MAKPTPPIEIDFETVKKATSIEPLVLNEEFIRLPGDLAYWNSVYADALDRVLRARRDVEKAEAVIREQYRDRVPPGEKVTEKYLDACVAKDPSYLAMRQEEDESEVAKVRAAGVVDAIRSKKEMLVSLGANIRAEREPGPTINTMERRLEEMERKLGFR